jgi:hypothetical protein
MSTVANSHNWKLYIGVAGFALSVVSLFISYTVNIAIQRAFLTIKEFQAFVVNSNLVIMPKWQNTGGTPTSDYTSYANWRAFSEVGVPSDFDFPDVDKDGKPISNAMGDPAVIAPKGDLLSQRLEIPIAYVEQARKGNGTILIYGWAKYDDVFWLTRSHKTEFANVVEIATLETDDQAKVTAGISFPLLDRHNTAN